MQNLTLNLTPTANAKSAQASNTAAQTETKPEGAALPPRNVFANVLNHQLLQQRKLQQTSTTEPLADSKLAINDAIGFDEALLEGAADLVASVDNGVQGLPAQDASAQTRLQEMLLMQMQTPMAANAAITAIKSTPEGAQTTDSQEFMLAQPSEEAASAILNGENPSKNSAHDLLQTQAEDLADSKRQIPIEVSGRDMSMSREQAEVAANKATEPVFKEALSATMAAQANQQVQVLSKAEANSASQAVSSSYSIGQAFGKTEWNQAIHQRVIWMVGEGDQSATLTLNPPELGPLKVVVQVDNQFVNTTFTSDDAHVRQALEDGMQILREKMQESGMQLGNAHVNSGSQSERDAQQAADQSQRQRAAKANNDALVTEQAPQVQRYVNRGLVDTFA